MIYSIAWYLIITITGWLVFPLAYHLLPALADRGYGISRALGLVLWGYLAWLLSSLGIVQFSSGSLVFTLSLVLCLSVWALRASGILSIRQWISDHNKYILFLEVLFLLAFAGWAVVRAANPEAAGTEKPMELAFINAILNSPAFPPHDPWLSGFAISYYYFGYVLVGILAKVGQTPASVAFNLGSVLIFALTTIGSYSLVYNIISVFQKKGKTKYHNHHRGASIGALLGPLFLLIVSNLEGFLHSLHNRGVFWTRDNTGQLISSFWRWLDIKDLNLPPSSPFSWRPSNFWWWWRASRVVQDYDLAGDVREIINEFPFFSFLLGDLHPHVLALPFALLVMTLALNIILGGSSGDFRWLYTKRLNLNPAMFCLLAVILGSIAFLNTWDLPAHLVLTSAAYTLPMLWVQKKKPLHLLSDFLWFAGLLTISSIFLFLPFYLGFASQAGGILPNMIYPTRGAHLWVMFAPFLFPLFVYLLYLGSKTEGKTWLSNGLIIVSILFSFLFLFALFLGFLITLIPEARSAFLGSLAAVDYLSLVKAAFYSRLESPGGWVTMGIFLALNLGLISIIFKTKTSSVQSDEPDDENSFSGKAIHTYLLCVIAIGALLITGPEFVYLRDQFGWRMNTIFKFYYQGWLLWSVAASACVIYLSTQTNRTWKILTWFGMAILIWMGLFYPVFSLESKTNRFKPGNWTLDGAAYLEHQTPAEMQAIEWLQSMPPGVVAEAVPLTGGSYTQYARVSMLSGKSAVLGWMGHESQWRGGNKAMGSRQNDLARLYCSRSWEDTQAILEEYQIRYIFIGNLERSTYLPGSNNCSNGINDTKFARNLRLVYDKDQILIYDTLGLVKRNP